MLEMTKDKIMSYVNDTLLPNETVRYQGHVHWIVFMPPLLISASGLAIDIYLNQMIVSGLLVFVSIWFFLKAFIYFFTTELAVTDQRVISKFGLIRRITFELNLDRVMSLNVNQTVLGRMLDYGDLFINGIGGISTPIPVISDPITFRRWVLGEVDKA
jgi:uncharacterized membrane protein YdbT with pleckstrin-like domain